MLTAWAPKTVPEIPYLLLPAGGIALAAPG